MSPQEAFRLGFLARCLEEQLTPEEVAERLETSLEKSASFPGETVASTAGNTAGLLAGLSLAAPPALGYLAGIGAAKATNEEITPEDAQKQELIDEYRRLAARARRNAALRRAAMASQGSSSSVLGASRVSAH